MSYKGALKWSFYILTKTKEIHYLRAVHMYEEPVIRISLLWVCPVQPNLEEDYSAFIQAQ